MSLYHLLAFTKCDVQYRDDRSPVQSIREALARMDRDTARMIREGALQLSGMANDRVLQLDDEEAERHERSAR